MLKLYEYGYYAENSSDNVLVVYKFIRNFILTEYKWLCEGKIIILCA